MIIKGKLGEYEVYWITWGYSYTRISIRVKKECKFLWMTWTNSKVVWTSEGKGFNTAKYEVERYTPSQIRDWFQSAVDEYEKHLEEWADEKEKPSVYA